MVFVASGGFTHFVVDEKFDREMIDALCSGDVKKFAAMPEHMFQSGTSEFKNWIVVTGAMVEAGLRMRLVDYVPCYRSAAGTGTANCFASWQ